jgi:leucyl-tRNA synthetase
MWMQGYNVLHPMGWDAFGLPAENAALKNNTPPREWTLKNIAAMKQQMLRLGFGYDWANEVTTCLPDYYRWNQWFFLRMYERGLAYRKQSKVNWCSMCATVLANEQVVEGCCWRHEDNPVELRNLEQWFYRITNYAQELLDDLDKLDGWPEKVKTMQRNWIGRSEGTEVDFTVDQGPGIRDQGSAGQDGEGAKIRVFTTRVDTIFGATSVQLAPEHPLVPALTAGNVALEQEIAAMIDQQKSAREAGDLGAIEKYGVFTGRYAVNPYNDERVPVWVGNYILSEYGTGAIMSVPGHDERDYEFATKYGLDIRRVIRQVGDSEQDTPMPFISEQGILINSGDYDGLSCEEAQKRLQDVAVEQGFGEAKITFRLRDWGVSRQRYWGTPIPMVNCPNHGLVPVPDDQLPVLLPDQIEITQEGGSPLKNVSEFFNTKCPKCDGPATRETDTMDTFVDSSWYFYRYADAKNSTAPVASEIANYWFPIDQYIGGVEHAILHLIYSRFFTKVMRDLGLIKNDEPVRRLFTQGMVIKDGAKMSKSRGNIVSPEDMIDRFGVDATRMYALFAAPPDRDVDWQEDGVAGVSRFLSRVYRMVMRYAPAVKNAGKVTSAPEGVSLKLLRKMHQTIAKITMDFSGRWHFNTSIAAVMELVNEMIAAEAAMVSGEVAAGVVAELLRNLVLMLAPFAPFLAAELWEELGGEGQVLRAPWPLSDPALAREDEIEIPVQVNGKLRAVIRVDADADQQMIEAVALADAKVVEWLAGKTPAKIIIVPRKLVNLVVK